MDVCVHKQDFWVREKTIYRAALVPHRATQWEPDVPCECTVEFVPQERDSNDEIWSVHRMAAIAALPSFLRQRMRLFAPECKQILSGDRERGLWVFTMPGV